MLANTIMMDALRSPVSQLTNRTQIFYMFLSEPQKSQGKRGRAAILSVSTVESHLPRVMQQQVASLGFRTLSPELFLNNTKVRTPNHWLSQGNLSSKEVTSGQA
jgi:DNA-binding CsgD family transcriptional regulator